jgi:hypothetical protein
MTDRSPHGLPAREAVRKLVSDLAELGLPGGPKRTEHMRRSAVR